MWLVGAASSAVFARTVEIMLQEGVDFYVGTEDAEAYDDPTYLPTANLIGLGERGAIAYPHFILIRFRDIKRLLDVTNITKAELQLYLIAEESPVPAFVSTFRVLQDWDEPYIEQSQDGWYTYRELRTWNAPGLAVANNIAAEDGFADRSYLPMPQTVIADGIQQWYAWDITEAVQHWYDNSWKEYGIVLTGANVANSFKQFASSEYPDVALRPRLVITHNPEELISDVSARVLNGTTDQTIFKPDVPVVVSVRAVNDLAGLAATIRARQEGYDTGWRVMRAGLEAGVYEYDWSTIGLASGEYTFTIKLVNPETKQQDILNDFVLTIDADPPQGGTLTVNQGATETTVPEVTLEVSVSDAVEMRFSGDLLEPAAEWMLFAQSMPGRLTDGDGLKSVSVEFRDAAGNVSPPIGVQILLDATPIAITGLQSWDAEDPVDRDSVYRAGKRIVIQVEVEETNLVEATLQITGDAYDSGIQALTPGQGGSLSYEWETTLLVDGVYGVQIHLQDAFGRVTQYPPEGEPGFTITLDSLPPADPKVIILDAGTQTQTRTLSLGLEAQGATQMFLSGDLLDDASTFEWVPFQSQARVHLVGGDGPKQIKAQFRDAAENESIPVQTSIRLEVEPPAPLDYGTLVFNADRSGTLTLFFDEPVAQILPDSFQMILHNTSADQEILRLTAVETQAGVDGERVWVRLPADNPLQIWTLSPGGSLLLWAEIAADSVADSAGNSNQEQPADFHIQIQVLNPGQLGSATATPSLISPNADGVQDSVEIQYTPLQNGTIRLRAIDVADNMVYEQTIANQRQGVEYQIAWAGVDSDGNPLLDGTYTLSLVLLDPITALEMPLLDSFAVSIDTQAPVIQDIVPVSGSEIPIRPTLSVLVFEQGGAGLKEVYLSVDQSTQQWALTLDGDRYTLAPGEGPSLGSGEHTFEFHTEDNAGNHTQLNATYKVVASEAPILRFFNFPNPFPTGASTQLLLSLNRSISGGHVRIYNGAGDLVFYMDLQNVGLTPGEYRIPWDGRNLYGDLLSRGVYFAEVRIEPGGGQIKRSDRVRRHKVAIW